MRNSAQVVSDAPRQVIGQVTNSLDSLFTLISYRDERCLGEEGEGEEGRGRGRMDGRCLDGEGRGKGSVSYFFCRNFLGLNMLFTFFLLVVRELGEGTRFFVYTKDK